jgi:hypothetical protein
MSFDEKPFSFTELSITVMTNVLFISLFIGIFFFTYAAYIEAEVVKSQMEFLATEISNSIKFLGPDITNKINDTIHNLPPINLDSADSAVATMNNSTKIKALIANIVFLILVIIGVYFLSKYDDTVPIYEILTKNLIILIFIGFTEYAFLTFFGSKYISLNPNYVNYIITDNLKQFFT